MFGSKATWVINFTKYCQMLSEVMYQFILSSKTVRTSPILILHPHQHLKSQTFSNCVHLLFGSKSDLLEWSPWFVSLLVKYTRCFRVITEMVKQWWIRMRHKRTPPIWCHRKFLLPKPYIPLSLMTPPPPPGTLSLRICQSGSCAQSSISLNSTCWIQLSTPSLHRQAV